MNIRIERTQGALGRLQRYLSAKTCHRKIRIYRLCTPQRFGRHRLPLLIAVSVCADQSHRIIRDLNKFPANLCSPNNLTLIQFDANEQWRRQRRLRTVSDMSTLGSHNNESTVLNGRVNKWATTTTKMQQNNYKYNKIRWNRIVMLIIARHTHTGRQAETNEHQNIINNEY